MNLPESELARVVLAQAWQVTLLIVFVAVVARYAARNRPHLAHVLWVVVLIKCLTPPLWSSPSGIFCWLQRAETERAAVDVSAVSFAELANGTAVSELTTEFAPPSSDVVVDVSSLRHDMSLATTPADWDSDIAEIGASPFGSIATTLLLVWLVGAAVVISVAAARWAVCLWMVKRSGVRSDGPLDDLMISLSERLNLKRRVRLVITQSRVGPAVIAWFRPIILLPEVVVRGKSPEELEPIMAHELIHVRRGDLRVGMLQVLASAVWWFHPLVRLAARWTNRESERCCDEEVIAELGCDPARYARSLLDILELKRTLTSVPAFPGVRPVEITSKRLERIMSLGETKHRRTPRWCWAVMIAVAAAVLPGAAFMVAAGDEPSDAYSTADAQSYVSGTPSENERPAKKYQTVAVMVYPKQTVEYHVDELLERIKAERKIDEAAAKDFLKQRIKDFVGGSWDDDVSPATAHHDNTGTPSSVESDADLVPRMQWVGNSLLALHSEAGHSRIEQAVNVMREYGFGVVKIETRIVTGRAEDIDAVANNWTVLPASVSATDDPIALINGSRLSVSPSVPIDRPLPNAATKQHSRARVSVEKEMPVLLEILDKKRHWEMIEQFQGQERTNLFYAPTVTLFSGQTATIQDVVRRPFVVGMVEDQAQVRNVSEGLSMRVRPLLRNDNSIWLDSELTLSDIRSVETVTIQRSDRQDPVTFQVPEVSTSRFDASLDLPAGKTLLIGGLKNTDDEGKSRSTLLFITAARSASDEETALNGPSGQADANGTKNETSVAGHAREQTKSSADGRELGYNSRPAKEQTRKTMVCVYPVASIVGRRNGANSREERASNKFYDAQRSKPRVTHDFDSLVQLIITTVQPDTWDEVGGVGSIVHSETTLSLVVRHTEDAHREIAELLSQTYKRVLQDGQSAAAGAASEAKKTKTKSSDVLVVVYSVPDILAPRTAVVVSGNEVSSDSGYNRAITPQVPGELDSLVELITKAIEPRTWKFGPAPGSIKADAEKQCLIVRHTSAVHEKIAKLLGQIREMRQQQVVLNVRTIHAAEDRFFERLGFSLDVDPNGNPRMRLTSTQAKIVLNAAQASENNTTYQAPTFTLLNGQVADLSLPFKSSDGDRQEARLQFVPQIRTRTRHINMTYAVNARNPHDALAGAIGRTIHDGQTMLVDVTDQIRASQSNNAIATRYPFVSRLLTENTGNVKGRVLVLITPHITIEEQEELLLGNSTGAGK